MDSSSSSMNNEEIKICHRLTDEQIIRLESFFMECPHPNESQRWKLGEELNLRQSQIKLWFQNKRTQVKNFSDDTENMLLRNENLKIKCEIEAMRAALRTTMLCPPSGGSRCGREERERNLQKLRLDNMLLIQEYERLSSYAAENGGQSSVDSSTSVNRPSSNSSTSNNRPALYGTSSNHLLEQPSLLRGPSIPDHITQTIQVPEPVMDKTVLTKTATKAVAEVIRLINMKEPMWVKSVIDGRLVIDQENYKKLYTGHSKCPNVRIESSKEVVVVPIDARNLVAMFSDTETRERLFPTIVNESRTLEVLKPMDIQRKTFTKLIYEKLHILSPLVPPREFMILRSFQQMEKDTWVIADVSSHLPVLDYKYSTPTCYKRPSGCLIQALPNGHSKVTWMEHVEVNDKVRTHRLYRDLLCGGFGYGARRWTVSLERMCQRLCVSSLSVLPTTDYGGVVRTMKGRKSVMSLGERMVKNLSCILEMAENVSQVGLTNTTGVRVSVRTSRAAGLVVYAALSLCLPLSPLQVYNFFRNLELRHQWDILCQGNPVTEVARFVTGTDPKNSVTILKSKGETEASEMMIIQDGFIDALGGMVVYAPMDLSTAYAVVSGQNDRSYIETLPSGFIISRDGHPSATNGGNDNCKTVLTLAFQISATHDSGDFNMEDSTATVNTLISSTAQRIKIMLNCEDGQ